MANDLKKGAAAKTQRPERMNLENDDKYPYHCSACGKGYMRQKDNFNVTPSPYYAGNGGYLTICRRCLDKSFEYYRDEVFDGDQDKAMELLCATINTCFERSMGKCQKAPVSKQK